MTIIDLTFVHVGTGLLSASRQPWVNYTLAAYLAWRDMSSLVSWLAIVDLVVVMVVVVPDWWGFEPRPRCSSTKPPRGDGKEAAAPFPPKCLTALTITLEYTGYKRISERNDLHNPHSPTLMFTHSHTHPLLLFESSL